MKALVLLAVLARTAAADEAKPRCVIDNPAPAPSAPLPPPACHRAPPALEAPVTAELAKQFKLGHQDNKLQVTFPCDGLGAQLDEIILETGGGHGGSLDVFRARRTATGYEVRGLVYRGESMTNRAANPPFQRVAGTVVLDPDRVRAALTAKLTEVEPPPKAGMTLGRRGFSSSNDFHVLIRLRDGDGRVVERRYTGYASSSDQQAYVGLLLAEQALAPITKLAATTAPVDAEDRALFAERFNAAVPSFDRASSWWVMERYVDLARFLGSPKVIRGLLTRMTVPKPGDRSRTDARRDALAALAAITGWDARKTAGSDEAAAKAYLANCR